jgi:predicted nucleic acid-binding protein
VFFLRKLKLYIDTSTISHLFADDTPDKMEDTIQFWKDCISGKYDLFISPIVIDEVEKCAEPKRSKMYERLEQITLQVLDRNDEVVQLAKKYINSGVLKEKSFDDCLHIAFAAVYDCDILVSWNFKHLVNFKTINGVRIVNATNRYREISLVAPNMLLEEDDE